MTKTRKRLKNISRILFIVYIIAALYFLFFSEFLGRTSTSEEFRYNITLFKEINRFWIYRHQLGIGVMLVNIAGNVLCFVPFGTFLPMISKKRALKNPVIVTFLAFMFSLIVEISQLIMRVGAFDVDDLLLNTIGGFIGYILYFILSKSFNRYGRKKKNRILK